MHARIPPCVALLFVVFPMIGVGQVPDSTTFPLEEIVVTATRFETIQKTSSAAVVAVTREQLGVTPGTLVVNALACTPGVTIRSYGSGAGAVQTLSMRGMGAENVLVLVDGERISNDQNGNVDFGLIPASSVERVEIVRGGYSGLYGTDAVGGVVNVITRSAAAPWFARALVGLGSFGFAALEGEARGEAGGVAGRLLVRRERGRNDFGFRFDDGLRTSTLARAGADYLTDQVNASASTGEENAGRYSVRVDYVNADRGSPGPVTDTRARGRARLYDTRLVVGSDATWQPGEGFHTTLHSAFQYDGEQFHDPATLLGGLPLRTSTVSRSFSFAADVGWVPGEHSSWIGSAEICRAWLTGTETGEALRWRGAFTAGGQVVVPLDARDERELILSPSLRYDNISDVENALSGRLGANVLLMRSPEIRLRGGVSRNFRAPTFNELYWLAGGNPDLVAERSTAADAGVIVGLDILGPMALDVGGFVIDSRDRIVWLPATGIYWSPRNLSRVVSRGGECEGRWHLLANRLQFTVNATWYDTRKRGSDFPGDPSDGKMLVYVPLQTASFSAFFFFGEVALGLQHFWSSYRFTTTANDHFLPSYRNTSGSVRYQTKIGGFSASVKGEVLNIFDESYQVMALYPMPGREIRVSLEVRP